MLRISSITTLIGIAILLSGGCDSKSTPTEKQDATPQAAAAHGSDDGHTHAPGEKCTGHAEAGHDNGKAAADDHEGHDHGKAGHDDHEGHDHGEAVADDHEGHDHGEAGHDEHEGHDHGEAGHDEHAGHGHSGERHELGNREIAGLTVKVAQFGAATDNAAELVFEVNIQGEPSPTAVRLLVRTPDGSESLKVKANKTGDHKYDAHVGELPTKIAEGSVVVIEVETPAGTEELTLPLKT